MSKEDDKQIEFYLNTAHLKVTDYEGVIRFTDKVKLILRAGAIIEVMQDDLDPHVYRGLILESSCNHNQQIHIGEIVIAFCQGAPGVDLTFDELMGSGGSPRPIINYSLDCSTSKISVYGRLFNDGLVYSLKTSEWVIKNEKKYNYFYFVILFWFFYIFLKH